MVTCCPDCLFWVSPVNDRSGIDLVVLRNVILLLTAISLTFLLPSIVPFKANKALIVPIVE